MYVLGVTGGLAAGKSTASRVFKERGALVIDTDDVAKRLLDEIPAVRERVVEAFGPDVVGPDGAIDRAALAARAFASKDEAARLEAIVHPAVATALRGVLDALSTADESPAIVVIVVPLLAEVPLLIELMDAVLAISVPEDVRIDRAQARGMHREDAENRVARQVGDAERREIADYVLENDGDLASFEDALGAFWENVIATREPRASDLRPL